MLSAFSRLLIPMHITLVIALILCSCHKPKQVQHEDPIEVQDEALASDLCAVSGGRALCGW